MNRDKVWITGTKPERVKDQLLITDLLNALRVARKTIKEWHGDIAWSEYQSSPEMDIVNSAILSAENHIDKFFRKE